MLVNKLTNVYKWDPIVKCNQTFFYILTDVYINTLLLVQNMYMIKTCSRSAGIKLTHTDPRSPYICVLLYCWALVCVCVCWPNFKMALLLFICSLMLMILIWLCVSVWTWAWCDLVWQIALELGARREIHDLNMVRERAGMFHKKKRSAERCDNWMQRQTASI